MLPKALLPEVEFGAWKAEIEDSRELREIFMNSNPLIHTCALAREDSKLALPGLSTENCSKTVLRGKRASGAHAGPFWSGAAAPREAGRGVAKTDSDIGCRRRGLSLRRFAGPACQAAWLIAAFFPGTPAGRRGVRPADAEPHHGTVECTRMRTQ